MSPEPEEARTTRGAESRKWLAPGSGTHYSSGRFATPRAAARDLRLIEGLLDEFLGKPREGVPFLLDAPCGAGRLAPMLSGRARRLVGLDASRDMLAAAREAQDTPSTLLEGDLLDLPFRDGSFDAVVACRFLHHLRDEAQLDRALGELVRVSRGLVIASFWDERSLPGWRRRLGLKRDEGPRGRAATSRGHLAAALARAGADVLAWRASLRFVSQQSFFAARVRPREA